MGVCSAIPILIILNCSLVIILLQYSRNRFRKRKQVTVSAENNLYIVQPMAVKKQLEFHNSQVTATPGHGLLSSYILLNGCISLSQTKTLILLRRLMVVMDQKTKRETLIRYHTCVINNYMIMAVACF